MKVAFDLNDVIRDFTRNFAKIYQREYNREINIDEIEVTTNDMSKVFPFDSKAEYTRFVYNDYPYELFGKCDTVESWSPAILNNWMEELKNYEEGEDVDVMIVSPMEYGLTIQSTYFFLSKIACRVREVYFPVNSETIWEKCDVLVTANPKLLDTKPEDKVAIKINVDYNKNSECTESYDNVSEFLVDVNNLLKLRKE